LKTTIAGILTILGGLITYAIAFLNGHAQDPAALGAAMTAIVTGIGLIKAADAPTPPAT